MIARCVSLPATRAIALTLLLGLSSIAGMARAAPATYRIDPEHFSIGFLVSHIGYERLLGQFLEGEGEFVYDEATRALGKGRIEIAADSVFTNHDARDSHVRGGDFLAAGRYPAIVFESTRLITEDGRHGTLTGDLTLRGQTHPVTLEVTLNKAAVYPFGHKAYTLGVSARTTLSRSRWGMTYGVADGLVGDEVEVLLEFEAIRQ